MNHLLILFMDDWLMDLSDFFLVNDWLMNLMDDVLMVLMNYVLMMLMKNILMMFMYNILVMLLYNRLVYDAVYYSFFLMPFNYILKLVFLDNWFLFMSNNSGCLRISFLNSRLVRKRNLLETRS
jgi:hypothetical protein